MSENSQIKISYSRPLLSVQDIVNYIDKGEKYLTDGVEIKESNPMDYLGAIILNPPYQREYRSSIKEESMIIESILLNIPIPEVFLVQVPDSGCQVRNVMDGRHRLNAIYRFVKGKYKLQGLDIIAPKEKYNGYAFNDLVNEDKIKILTYKISALEFVPLEDENIERELFTRYNKATKPLEPQEIRYATYTSNTSLYVSRFVHKLVKQEKAPLYKAYNITDSRSKMQKVHQNIFTLLFILEYGLDVQYFNSTELADVYMKNKNDEFREKKENQQEILNTFTEFNNFVSQICEYEPHPFSIRLFEYKTGAGNYLFRTSISMFLAALFYYCEFTIDENFIEEFKSLVEIVHCEKDIYDNISTNSKLMAKAIINLDNTLQNRKTTFNNIRFKSEKINLLKTSIEKNKED